MSAIVVDTSSWISYFKNFDHEGISEGLQEGRVHLPFLVASELLSAQLKPSEHKQMLDFLSDLPSCANDFEHWVRVGELRRGLFRKGVHLSTPDAHVAQSAIELKAVLISEDKIFQLVSKHTSLNLSERLR